MKIPFNKIDNIADYEPLPDGTYSCRVADVKEGVSSKGSPLWRLRLVVLAGDHVGRAVFDQLVFSPAALRRVKLVCACLGLDVNQPMDLAPDMLVGRTCRVQVITEEYVDQEGESRRANKVPFDGYQPTAAPGDDSEDGMPF